MSDNTLSGIVNLIVANLDSRFTKMLSYCWQLVFVGLSVDLLVWDRKLVNASILAAYVLIPG